MSAQRLLAFVCMASFWLTGRFVGEFYPFSPLSMFDQSTKQAARLFVRDSSGAAREIGRYVDWRCEGSLDFTPPSGTHCPDGGYSAYEEIVRDHIVAYPARNDDVSGRETLEITRRVFEIPDPYGPVRITDCPLLRCTARRRSWWTHRL